MFRFARRRWVLAMIVAAFGATVAGPLEGQQDSPVAVAIAGSDSVRLAALHWSSTDAQGLTITGQTFNSSVGDLPTRQLPELRVAPLTPLRIILEPRADSAWVTPVVEGERDVSGRTDLELIASAARGPHEYLVKGIWAANEDGTPAGPARTGTWAFRVVVQ